MEVALVANLKQNAPTWSDMPPEQWDDLDSWETIQSITIALEKGGHRVTFLEGDKSLYNNLAAVKPDICFNLCRGHFGDSRAAQIPAILELLRIPYTGSGQIHAQARFDVPRAADASLSSF
jgi:D-alanine-D-alanine ligase